MNIDLKKKLIQHLRNQIEKRITDLEKSLALIIESRNTETKSSVGDKYETSRSMMQMEIDNYSAQISNQNNLKLSLNSIPIEKEYSSVESGSMVNCKEFNFFISIAFGKTEFNKTYVYCLSPNSPIGQILLKKKTGDEIFFQGKKIVIEKII